MSAKNKSKVDLRNESIGLRYALDAEPFGKGGNAKVYRARDIESCEEVAIKILATGGKEKIQRFADEIDVMLANADVRGVMPVLAADKDNHWYAMPMAKPLMEWTVEQLAKCRKSEYLINHTDRSQWIRGVVERIIQCADTLVELHKRGIHHRDIKPANMYLHDNVCCLGDFGLVEFPDRDNNLTREDKGLGAIFTIAPEMKRNPKEADASKADVYSLAKSLWMLLTLDEKGFDGQYAFNDRSHALRQYPQLEEEYLVEIEELLTAATPNSPEDRPDMEQLRTSLATWLANYSDEERWQTNEWKFIARRIFGENMAQRTVFSDPAVTVRVLNILASSRALNHMMFPHGGGLDLQGAELAAEPGFIYLKADHTLNLLRPKALYFESFPDSRWNYFLLEADEVDPVEDIGVSMHGDQSLVEDIPGHYVKADDSVYGVYDYDTAEPLPDGWKQVCRFTKGKFLIVMKTFGYNHIQATYDGRHAVMTNDELRDYFIFLQRMVRMAVEKGYKEEMVLRIPEFGAHPYPERIDRHGLEFGGERLPDPDDYIKTNLRNWNFKSILTVPASTGKLAFRFVFDNDTFHSLFEERQELYLAADGTIVQEDAEDAASPYEVRGRDLAIELLGKLNDSIAERCKGYDTTHLRFGNHFDIEMRMLELPIHLFTKEEIEHAMRNADDRLGNQLVIDEEGYAHVIPQTGPGYGSLYPVSHEAWGARNNYVGKYSDLPTLEKAYTDSLQCWLRYLHTGQHQYCSELPYADPAQLIESIQALTTTRSPLNP